MTTNMHIESKKVAFLVRDRQNEVQNRMPNNNIHPKCFELIVIHTQVWHHSLVTQFPAHTVTGISQSIRKQA